LTDDELIGVLRAARRLASRDAALELSAVADLAARRRATAAAEGDPRSAEHVDDEVAAALTLTRYSAATLHDLALGVTRLPGTLSALSAGLIDQRRAAVIATETSALGDVAAAAVGAAVIGVAPGQTTGELRAEVRRMVITVDPSAARRRKEAAQKQARVELWQENAGTCALAGRDLPPGLAVAADKHLSAAARYLKTHGAEGTLSQLRAGAYLTLLTGQSLDTLVPAATDMAGPGVPGPGTPGTGTPAAGTPGTGTPGAGIPGTSSGLPVLAGSVNLTLPLSTWLGWSQSPGQVPGFGPLDAEDSRTLAAMLARHPATKWCLTLTDPAGYPVAHGCARTSPGPPPARNGPPPGSNGPPSGSDPHGGQWPPSGSDPPGGREPASGTDPPVRHTDQPLGDTDPPPRDTEPQPGSTGPPPGDTGPPGASRPDPSSCTGTDPGPRLAGAAGWLATIALTPLPSHACDHAQETAAYRPPGALQHLIRIRHQTCTSPGCRYPADRCDLDHSLPYDQGGRTCWCNLGPVCRRGHRCKQAPGWKLEQTSPGTFTWTTPAGRTYITTPTRYPT